MKTAKKISARARSLASRQFLGGAVGKKVSELRIQALLQEWYDRIKTRLPAGSSLMASVQRPRQGEDTGILVSFRAETEGEVFIAEARSSEPARAVEEAGGSLYRRLASNLPDQTLPFTARLRNLLSEAS